MPNQSSGGAAAPALSFSILQWLIEFSNRVKFFEGAAISGRSVCFPSWQQLRPVLEVHCVEVAPFAAPDKAMSFEDFYDVEGDAVSVGTLRP